MNYTNLTLGELLSNENETIRRNAISILKQLQRKRKDLTRIKSTGELSDITFNKCCDLAQTYYSKGMDSKEAEEKALNDLGYTLENKLRKVKDIYTRFDGLSDKNKRRK